MERTMKWILGAQRPTGQLGREQATYLRVWSIFGDGSGTGGPIMDPERSVA